jgi:transcriptional regulator with XRE-family HTH domain
MSKKKHEMIHQIDIIVGHNIKKRRIQLNLSQSKLAINIGLTFQQIQKYESGKNRVSASMLYEIARSLRTSIEYFFSNTDKTLDFVNYGVLADGADEAYIADDRTLFAQFMQIKDKKVKESVIELIRNLVSSKKTKA